MIYTLYDPTTGEIQGHIQSDDPDLLQQNLQNQHYVSGHFDSDTHYVVNGQACEKPANPGSPLVPYQFDYATGTWQYDVAQGQVAIRNLRNILLDAIDRVNPMWYATLSQQQQQELQAYRQALLDVPQQAGFPGAVEWPSKPQWL